MSPESQGRKIDINDLKVQAERTQEQAQGLLGQIRSMMPTTPGTFIGEIFLGSAKKTVQQPDGQIAEEDWSWNDLVGKFSEGLEEDDRYTRADMQKEFQLITSAHFLLARSPNTQLATHATEIIGFTEALFRRYIVAPGDLTYRYPTPMDMMAMMKISFMKKCGTVSIK